MGIAEMDQMTVSEFEEFVEHRENQDGRYELINGKIVVKPFPTQEHGLIRAILCGEIGAFLQENPIGFGVIEVLYKSVADDQNARQPNLSVSLDMTRPIVEMGAVPGMPDFAVEIKLPDNTYKELREKAEYYLAHGTKLVWLVYPRPRVVEVFRPDVDSEMLTIDDTLTGGDVLPEFKLAMRDVFRKSGE